MKNLQTYKKHIRNNYLASSDPHPAKKSEFIRHLCVTFICAIYIWHLYLTLVFVIHIWHVAFAFVFGIHLRLLYLTFTSYIYICHLCLTTIFDFYTLQGHGTPLGFSLDPKCEKPCALLHFCRQKCLKWAFDALWHQKPL